MEDVLVLGAGEKLKGMRVPLCLHRNRPQGHTKASHIRCDLRNRSRSLPTMLKVGPATDVSHPISLRPGHIALLQPAPLFKGPPTYKA